MKSQSVPTENQPHFPRWIPSSQAGQIFPCKLDEFIKLDDDASRHNWFNGKKATCHGCGKEHEKMNMCGGCKLVSYCSKASHVISNISHLRLK